MESKTSQGDLVEPKDKDKSPPTHKGHGGHRLTLDIDRWWSPPFSIPLLPSPAQTQWTRPHGTPTIHEQRPQPPLGTAGKAWRCGMAGLNEAGNQRNDPQRMDAAPREANVHGYPRTSRADKITLNAESKFYFPQFLLCGLTLNGTGPRTSKADGETARTQQERSPVHRKTPPSPGAEKCCPQAKHRP